VIIKMALYSKAVESVLLNHTKMFLGSAKIQQPSLSTKGAFSALLISSHQRWYRGSNRDTRRREHKLKNKIEKMKKSKEKLVFDRKAFMFNNFDRELFCFQKRLSLEFNNEDILKAAFVHPSFYERIKNEEDIPNFAVQNLGLVKELQALRPLSAKLTLFGLTQTYLQITSNVLNAFPYLPSTLISEISNTLAGRRTIARLAENLGIPEMIVIEHDIDMLQKEKHVPFTRSDVICDAFFGIMGAILQELGRDQLVQFIDDFVMTFLDEEDFRNEVNIQFPESTASEVAILAGFKEKLESRLMFKATDEAEFPLYVVGVFSGNTQLAEAADSTLKKARLAAFQDLIHSFMWIRQPNRNLANAFN